MFLPRALSATTDAQNALMRLKKLFHAPLRDPTPFIVHPDQKLALEIRGATFEWEESASAKEARELEENNKKKRREERAHKGHKDNGPEPDVTGGPFQVRDIDMLIPRGSLVAIVGSVGSGKVRICCRCLLSRETKGM